jgi:hypothetical protein
MHTFTVALAMALHGCTVGSTDDVADTTEEAERRLPHGRRASRATYPAVTQRESAGRQPELIRW